MEKPEAKQCSRCLKTKEQLHFDKDRKQCNDCIKQRHTYYYNNKDKHAEWDKKHYEKNKEHKQEYRKEYNQRKIDCQYCRCMVSLSQKAQHERTNKHINNVKNPKPPKTEEATKEYKQQTTQEEIRDYIETSSDFEYDINKE